MWNLVWLVLCHHRGSWNLPEIGCSCQEIESRHGRWCALLNRFQVSSAAPGSVFLRYSFKEVVLGSDPLSLSPARRPSGDPSTVLMVFVPPKHSQNATGSPPLRLCSEKGVRTVLRSHVQRQL